MYLGNNYWILNDGRLFNTKRQTVIEKELIPIFFKHKKTVGNFQLCEVASEFPSKVGTRFVLIDYCFDFKESKSGKTEYAIFENVKLVNKGYDGYKTNNNNFKKDCAYLLLLEVNRNYNQYLKLINHKKLKGNVKTKKRETKGTESRPPVRNGRSRKIEPSSNIPEPNLFGF